MDVSFCVFSLPFAQVMKKDLQCRIAKMKQRYLLFVGVLTWFASSLDALPHGAPERGWADAKNIFAFGDSYSSTELNLNLQQPNQANPLGNPAYPGYTSSNGPNWIDFLTTTYNESEVLTVNLAYGGATVDSSLVEPYLPTVLSLKQQIEDEFIPAYASPTPLLSWKPASTLFSIFIGINDIGNSYKDRNTTLIPSIFAVYAGLVDKLYSSGARNILLLNVPPIDRAPLTTAQDTSTQSLEASAVADWNGRVAALAKEFNSDHRDATAFVFEVNRVFSKVLDRPCSYEQTCPIENTTAYCEGYANGTPSWYSFNTSCGVPVDEYFWLNDLHPTFRIHNATAAAVAKQLSKRKWSI